MTLMFQLEVGKRITSVPKTKDYGRISIISQLNFKTKILFEVSRNCFTPPPKITSCIVQFNKLNNVLDIKTLKKQGYKLYLLTNITEDSYNYINDLININSIFDGGIYSYQEHIIKPDKRIYNLLIKKYNLNKAETIFFDDKEKNVISAINQGISSYVFKSIEDIKYNI